MNELNKKDKFTLYVFIVVMSTGFFSILLMKLLNFIYSKFVYKNLSYLVFVCITFVLSSVIASLIISNLAKKTKLRDELYDKMLAKISEGDFDFLFPLTGDEELNKDIKNFNLILKQLKSVAILKQDFISNFSHEFKTPITSIKGFAEVLMSKPDLPLNVRREYLQIIIDESTKLTNLSKNILLMGKLDSQVLQEKKEFYYLNDQLAVIILMLDSEITKKNIDTDINLQKIKIYACKEFMGHIWTNLLTNAIKFTKDKIKIDAYIENNNIIVKVADNGIGIKKEDLEHIFDKYYQCNTEKKSIGTGLGLSIVKKVTELVNAKIEVESEVNKGTCFIITIPNELNQYRKN